MFACVYFYDFKSLWEERKYSTSPKSRKMLMANDVVKHRERPNRVSELHDINRHGRALIKV